MSEISDRITDLLDNTPIAWPETGQALWTGGGRRARSPRYRVSRKRHFGNTAFQTGTRRALRRARRHSSRPNDAYGSERRPPAGVRGGDSIVYGQAQTELAPVDKVSGSPA